MTQATTEKLEVKNTDSTYWPWEVDGVHHGDEARAYRDAASELLVEACNECLGDMRNEMEKQDGASFLIPDWFGKMDRAILAARVPEASDVR